MQYLIGYTTTANIISETCRALWEALHQDVLPYNLEKKDWFRIADGFEKKCNFPHCIGAIDRKQLNFLYCIFIKISNFITIDRFTIS